MSDTEQTGTSSAELFGSDRMWGLKELPLPEPVSWWPQTIGWVGVLFIILCALTWLAWKRWQAYQHNLYRREGLVKLDSFNQNPLAIIELPLLLRSSALRAAPRIDVANLRGSDWITWLNKSGGSNLFEDRDAKLLDELAYAQPDQSTIDSKTRVHLLEASRTWMRSHRASV
ncbi:MAG: DUF4381 domain-containing protein [Rhizobiaceae bacterium]|nr:DUF4381 domain-containing protein [Rhizobiaceae bacterium]